LTEKTIKGLVLALAVLISTAAISAAQLGYPDPYSDDRYWQNPWSSQDLWPQTDPRSQENVWPDDWSRLWDQPYTTPQPGTGTSAGSSTGGVPTATRPGGLQPSSTPAASTSSPISLSSESSDSPMSWPSGMISSPMGGSSGMMSSPMGGSSGMMSSPMGGSSGMMGEAASYFGEGASLSELDVGGLPGGDVLLSWGGSPAPFSSGISDGLMSYYGGSPAYKRYYGGLQHWIYYCGSWSTGPAAFWLGQQTNTIVRNDQPQNIWYYDRYPNRYEQWWYGGYRYPGYIFGYFRADMRGWHQIAVWGSRSGWSNPIWVYVW